MPTEFLADALHEAFVQAGYETLHPMRQRRDEDDIVALLTLHLPTLNLALLEEYFALSDRRDDLARSLAEAQQRRA